MACSHILRQNVEVMYSILDDAMPVGCGAPYDKEHGNNDMDSIASYVDFLRALVFKYMVFTSKSSYYVLPRLQLIF